MVLSMLELEMPQRRLTINTSEKEGHMLLAVGGVSETHVGTFSGIKQKLITTYLSVRNAHVAIV